VSASVLSDKEFDSLQEFWLETTALVDEMHRAIDKHGWQNTPLNPQNDLRDSYIIIAEEVGEVARALTRDEGNLDNLQDELVQVATMCLATVVGIRGKLWNDDNGVAL
jgi:NTP pyrophosphatase (non-canonical NTP hydrolase)